jgi:hypothetical protein
MANPNKINGGLGGVGSGPKVDPQALIQKALSELLQKAGIPGEVDPKNLGAKAQAKFKEAEQKLQQGAVDPSQLAQLSRELRTAALDDQISSLKLSPSSGAAGQLPAASTPLATKNGDGSFALAGTVGSPTHGLFQLLEKLGFDPRALDANVVDRLDSAVRSRNFSLGSQQSVNQLASQLLELSPKAELRGVAPAKTSNASVQQSQSTTAQPVRNGAAQAPTATGKGTAANALNALITNRLTPNESKTAVTESRKAAVDALLGGVEVKPEVRAEVEKMLDKVLTDPSNPQQPNPGRVLSNAFVELSRATGERDWMKGAAFAHQLQAAVEKVPVDQRGAMEQNLAVMAVPLMELAAQAKLNKLTGGAVKLDTKPSADAMGALSAMLQSRGIDVGSVDPDKVLREARGGTTGNVKQTAETKQTQAAQAAGKVDGKDVKFDPKAEAKAFIHDELGVDPKDKNVGKALAGVEELLARAGSGDPAKVIQAAFDLFKEKTGVDHPYGAQLAQMQLGPDQLEVIKKQMMVKAAEAAVDPKSLEAAKAAILQAQAQQAAGMQGMGGMDGGVGPGIPGFTGMGMPSDMNNPMRGMQVSERAMIGASILRDPALTIEDKLFLFMMYMGMFASQDELKKAEELAELDRSEEARQGTIRKMQTSLQNETQTRGAAKRAAEEARSKFETVSNQPGVSSADKESAKREMEATGNAFKMSQEREKALQSDLNTLKGPQQLPKSREQLTMELRRMEDLKRLFQDMVQALLQSFKESTRSTIQQMGR